MEGLKMLTFNDKANIKYNSNSNPINIKPHSNGLFTPVILIQFDCLWIKITGMLKGKESKELSKLASNMT